MSLPYEWVREIKTVDADDTVVVNAMTANSGWHLLHVGVGSAGQTRLTFAWGNPFPPCHHSQWEELTRPSGLSLPRKWMCPQCGLELWSMTKPPDGYTVPSADVETDGSAWDDVAPPGSPAPGR